MPIVIKNADEVVYSRFKARAAEKGLRIGEAMTEAMTTWLEQEAKQDLTQIMAERNEVAFRRIFPTLLKQHEGQWGLISGGDLVGVYPTKRECLKAIQEHQLLEKSNLLFPIRRTASQRRIIGPYRRMSSAPKV
ncbi:MAG: hypothetical protein ACFFGZ_12285 [Candidatus Thorarchaeota archaeon]